MKLMNAIAIGLACLALGACSKEETSTTLDKASDATEQMVEETPEASMGAMETNRDATGEMVEQMGENVEETGKAINQAGESMQTQE